MPLDDEWSSPYHPGNEYSLLQQDQTCGLIRYDENESWVVSVKPPPNIGNRTRRGPAIQKANGDLNPQRPSKARKTDY